MDAGVEDIAHRLGVGAAAREIPYVIGIGAEQIVGGDIGAIAIGHALARRYRARRIVEPALIGVHIGKEILRHLQLLGVAVVENLKARGEGGGAAVRIGPREVHEPHRVAIAGDGGVVHHVDSRLTLAKQAGAILDFQILRVRRKPATPHAVLNPPKRRHALGRRKVEMARLVIDARSGGAQKRHDMGVALGAARVHHHREASFGKRSGERVQNARPLVQRPGGDLPFGDELPKPRVAEHLLVVGKHVLARQIGHHICAALHHAHVPQVVEEVVADSRGDNVVQRHDAPGANVGGDIEVIAVKHIRRLIRVERPLDGLVVLVLLEDDDLDVDGPLVVALEPLGHALNDRFHLAD